MSTFRDFMDIHQSVINCLIEEVSEYILNSSETECISNIIIYEYLYPSIRHKTISEFLLFCGRIMLRVKSIALKQKKYHRSNISNQQFQQNESLKHELSELIECQRLLSDAQSMYNQQHRLNDMIFGDYRQRINNVDTKDIEETNNIMVFPYETQIYLEIAFTQETLRSNFLENVLFGKLIRNKYQYFRGLYELQHLLEIYNVFWTKYRNQWTEKEVKEQDKLRRHYLGQCPCCQAMYQSLYDDDDTIKRSKMKEMAKTLKVNDFIDWSDEEQETEQEVREFNELANRLALLK